MKRSNLTIKQLVEYLSLLFYEICSFLHRYANANSINTNRRYYFRMRGTSAETSGI